MLTTTPLRGPPANRLLAALPKKEYQRLLPKLELVNLSFGDILFEPDDVITHVHFPNDSIISLLSAVKEISLGIRIIHLIRRFMWKKPGPFTLIKF